MARATDTLLGHRFATGDTTTIIRTRARPMATTDRAGSQAEYLSAPALGMAGADAVGAAGVTAGVDAGVGSITVGSQVDEDSQVDAVLMEHMVLAVHEAAMGSAVRLAASTVEVVVASTATLAEAASTAVVAVASTVVVADTAVADTVKLSGQSKENGWQHMLPAFLFVEGLFLIAPLRCLEFLARYFCTPACISC
jgi:hypothetical protein